MTLEELAALPSVISSLEARVRELETRLAAPAGDEQELLDAKAAAKLLGMSAAAVRKAAYRGALPCVRVGRRLRFRRSELKPTG